MCGLRQHCDLTIAGRNDRVARRIDREPFADHALRKDFVGHFGERQAPAIERREKLHGRISTQSSAHIGSSRGRAKRRQMS